MSPETKDIAAPPIHIPLNDQVRWILGRPNFWCGPIAAQLREKGYSIEKKSEDEQAAVIHWMLDLYLKRGDSWREEAGKELDGN